MLSELTEYSTSKPRYYVKGYTSGGSLNEADKTDPNSNYYKYGVLYNWEAAQDACPPGTHLPSDEEWNFLEKAFWIEGDDPTNKDGDTTCSTKPSEPTWARCAPASKALRNFGDGTNSSGLSVLPGGHVGVPGTFSPSSAANFWTSSRQGTTNSAWSRYLYSGYSTIYRANTAFSFGFSIRCVQ